MSIPTNANFDTANQQLVKQPLYILTIEGISEPLTTFSADQTAVTWAGYGLSGYGTTGYGY